MRIQSGILALALAKAWIVLTQFLGLREAPAGWRYGLIALIAALGGTIGAVEYQGAASTSSFRGHVLFSRRRRR